MSLSSVSEEEEEDRGGVRIGLGGKVSNAVSR